ncbi:MAG: sigma-54-dependent Fis family transcriptional regulator, partial [Devosiaceae bacterium]|nr:sigma-54-dependent Fis family transcriptional regulator [Devosiaceae bacterium MH13]
PIWVPPLRERVDDIPYLVEHFLVRFAAEEGKRHIKGISQPALELVTGFDWPGNIRQLENAVFRAVVLCDTDYLRPSDFPQIAAREGLTIAAPPVAPIAPSSPTASPSVAGSAIASPAISLPMSDYGMVDLTDGKGQPRRLAALEEQAIRFAVGHLGGHMSDVARCLGIGRSTLYRKLSDYQIDPASPNAPAEGVAEPSPSKIMAANR